MKEKKSLFRFLVLIIFGSFFTLSPHSLAVTDKMDGFGVPGLDFGGFFGLGQQVRRDTGSPPPASEAYSFGVYAAAGFSLLPGVKVGPYGEFHVVNERKNVAGAEDFDGNGYLLGLSTSLNIAPFYALAAYTFLGSYSRSGVGNRTLSSPQGVHGVLGFYVSKDFSIDASYGHILYRKEQDADEDSKDLGKDEKVKWRTFRLSFSVHL